MKNKTKHRKDQGTKRRGGTERRPENVTTDFVLMWLGDGRGGKASSFKEKAGFSPSIDTEYGEPFLLITKYLVPEEITSKGPS